MDDRKSVVVTGATGFIGSRLCFRLAEAGHDVRPIRRHDGDAALLAALRNADAVAHCAGVTRPRLPQEFDEGNAQLTRQLAVAIRAAGSRPLVLFTSSVRAAEDTHYGRTKKLAEDELIALSNDDGCVVGIFRLPQIFGRGARPHYNSIVATILADAAAGRETRIDNPGAPLELVDVADVVPALVATVARPPTRSGQLTVSPTYSSSVGQIAAIAAGFRDRRGGDDLDGLEAALWDAYCGYVEDGEEASGGPVSRSPHTP